MTGLKIQGQGLPTVSFAPHAVLDAMLFKQIPVTIRGILAAPVGMP
ncbi:hypothetical protein [Methyloglobulus sp.]